MRSSLKPEHTVVENLECVAIKIAGLKLRRRIEKFQREKCDSNEMMEWCLSPMEKSATEDSR